MAIVNRRQNNSRAYIYRWALNFMGRSSHRSQSISRINWPIIITLITYMLILRPLVVALITRVIILPWYQKISLSSKNFTVFFHLNCWIIVTSGRIPRPQSGIIYFNLYILMSTRISRRQLWIVYFIWLHFDWWCILLFLFFDLHKFIWNWRLYWMKNISNCW